MGALKGEAEVLRREVEITTEKLRRKDHIITGLTSRIPEFSAAAQRGRQRRRWRLWRLMMRVMLDGLG